MKNITKKELNRIAKEYGYDPQYLVDQVLDWESDGIRVDAQNLEDYCANGDICNRCRPSGRHIIKTKEDIYMNKTTTKNGAAEELELTDAQADRNDEIYEAAFEFCKVLTENSDLEWNMAFLGEIADLAASIMTRQGHKVRFPSVVTEQDGTQYIEEYYGD